MRACWAAVVIVAIMLSAAWVGGCRSGLSGKKTYDAAPPPEPSTSGKATGGAPPPTKEKPADNGADKAPKAK